MEDAMESLSVDKQEDQFEMSQLPVVQQMDVDSLAGRTHLRVCRNPRANRSLPYGSNEVAVLGGQAFDLAQHEISTWPGYRATPLRVLTSIATAIGVEAVLYKDESERFGIGSFKALGGAYAVCRILRTVVSSHVGANDATSHELLQGRYRNITSDQTVCCATDGNHGRSVAWGARQFSCKCVVYVPESVSEQRCRAIESYGARVVRFPGTYDDAVRQAASDASDRGWHVVSDTSNDEGAKASRDVMQGYSIMAEEVLEAVGRDFGLTHVFIQGGVGGVAAAVCGRLWEVLGSRRPRMIVVEPAAADCLFQSALTGQVRASSGSLSTVMSGLACGEPSALAWRVLQRGADYFVTIEDEVAEKCMRLLAKEDEMQPPIVAGESAVAGLAGLLAIAAADTARALIDLDSRSRVLLIGTEGDTAPKLYEQIVGESGTDVRRRQAIWLEQPCR